MGLEGFILLGETVVQKRVSFTCQYAGVLSSFLAFEIKTQNLYEKNIPAFGVVSHDSVDSFP